MTEKMEGALAAGLRTIDPGLLGDATAAAPALLGCRLLRLVRGRPRAGIIVETEAYPHNDPACHGFRGRTKRNATMFGAPGRAYVYRIHRSLCLNVVTGPEGRGEAVLIRAVEPEQGGAAMERARRRHSVAAHPPRGYQLTNGPGKLCQAFEITIDFDGHELLRPPASGNGPALLLLERRRPVTVATTARIGITEPRPKPLRFFIAGNPWVSP